MMNTMQKAPNLNKEEGLNTFIKVMNTMEVVDFAVFLTLSVEQQKKYLQQRMGEF